ncbi:MAG: hypothetical protein M3P18_12175 [Actinomycetota bacterium]|nr:hypothetical protein [Actinomycetota bacterium]
MPIWPAPPSACCPIASSRDRLGAISARLQAVPGTVRAADLIDRLARTGQSIAAALAVR